MFCRYMYPYIVNKPDNAGGLRDSRTDCLLLIDAFGSTRSCGQHEYLAAPTTLLGGEILVYERVQIETNSPILYSARIALDSDSREWIRDTWTRAQY
jgi:hypothetical protein